MLYNIITEIRFDRMVDSEEIHGSAKTPPDDISSLFGAVGQKNLKIAFFMFIVFVFLNSDVFVEKVLSNKENTYTEGRLVNANGTIVQGVFLAIIYIIISILVACDYV